MSAKHPIVQAWLKREMDEGGCIALLERELMELREAAMRLLKARTENEQHEAIVGLRAALEIKPPK